MSETEKEYIRKQIRKMGNNIIQTVKEEVFLCEITCDLDRFKGLVNAIGHHTAYELLKSLRNAGLSRDITRLADKAGKIRKDKGN